MEQIIKRALKVWNGVTYDSSLECYILEKIEDAGMLPPYTVELDHPKFKGIRQGHVWEPEDEKK